MKNQPPVMMGGESPPGYDPAASYVLTECPIR